MIYVVIGPTCSGKSDVAHMIAHKFKCPIINADAFQIYTDMNIGTNKVSENYELFSSYRMLNVITPDKTYSVKQYQEEARKELNASLHNYNDVVVVGGTGLYIKALLYDYVFTDENTAIDDDLLKMDNHSLHILLEKLDAKEAEKIHENNRKRLLRAITMIRHNNESKTEILSKQNHSLIFDSYKIKILYLLPDRNKLYEQINKRVIKMIESGLIDEVKNLLNKYDLSTTAKQGIGYKEVISYLNNECTMDECINLIQQRTRNYAKRQITFFSRQFENYIKCSSLEEAIQNI